MRLEENDDNKLIAHEFKLQCIKNVLSIAVILNIILSYFNEKTKSILFCFHVEKSTFSTQKP